MEKHPHYWQAVGASVFALSDLRSKNSCASHIAFNLAQYCAAWPQMGDKKVNKEDISTGAS